MFAIQLVKYIIGKLLILGAFLVFFGWYLFFFGLAVFEQLFGANGYKVYFGMIAAFVVPSFVKRIKKKIRENEDREVTEALTYANSAHAEYAYSGGHQRAGF